MIVAKFNQQTGILDSKFEGEISLKEIVDYIRATRSNESYPRSLKILTDSTKANVNFSKADLSKIIEENYKSLEIFNSITDAIVLTGTKETAFSFLYKELIKTNQYRFEFFSSREAAMEWLEWY